MGLFGKTRLLLHRQAVTWVTSLAIAVGMIVTGGRAAENVAVISIKPTEQLLSDVEYLLQATGTAPLGQFFMPQVRAFNQGINGNQPIGIVVTVENQSFKVLGFLPVTDLQTVLTNLEPQLGKANEVENGILELQGPQPVFIKEQQGWAFIGQSMDALSDLPNNPADWLGDLPKRYDIGVRAFVKNVPDAYKQMAIGQAREAASRQMRDKPEQVAKQVEQLTQLLNEADAITLGWQIDPKQREMHLEMSLKPLPQTEMAQQVTTMRKAKTEFGGFLMDEAAVRGNLTSVLLPDQIDQAMSNIDRLKASTLEELDKDESLDEGTRQATKEVVTTFFKIAVSTVQSGRLDSCTSVLLEPNNVTILSASHVGDGQEVEDAVKQLVQAAENQPELKLSNVQFNADQHAGVRFHSLAIPIPEDEQSVRKVMGETLKVTVGASDESAYVAIGKNGLAALKSQIDGSQNQGQSSVDPFFGEVAFAPILAFMASVEPNPMVRSLSALLEGQPDRLHIRAHVTDDGSANYRLTLQEGVLGVIGQGAQMVGVNGPPRGGSF